MASEKQPRRDIRQPILIVYVGICVMAVVLTVVIAFSEAGNPPQAATPSATRTLSPAVLTLQADEPEHISGQREQGRGSDVTLTAPATARATPASLTDLSEGH